MYHPGTQILRGSTPFAADCGRSFHDDNGITVPYWGLSETVWPALGTECFHHGSAGIPLWELLYRSFLFNDLKNIAVLF